MTINVGLGTGSKAEQLAQLQLIIGAQKEAIAAGLVSAKNLFHSAKELVKLAGHKNADAFFTPPGAPADPNDPASAPIQPPADPKHAEIAAKAQTEQAKITADAAHQKMKLDAQLAFEHEKFALEKELKLLDLQIARERHQHWRAPPSKRLLMPPMRRLRSRCSRKPRCRPSLKSSAARCMPRPRGDRPSASRVRSGASSSRPTRAAS